jgi:hypothetical protein
MRPLSFSCGARKVNTVYRTRTMKKTIVALKKLTSIRRVTSTKTVSVAASSGPARAKRDYLDEPIELPSEEVLPLEGGFLQEQDMEPDEAADLEDEERPEEQHDLEARQGRNLCPLCPIGVIISRDQASGGNNAVYCCPSVKVIYKRARPDSGRTFS